MKRFRVKICGLNDPQNIIEVACLQPDYIGLILYHRSPRYCRPGILPDLLKFIPRGILKVGVLVNEEPQNACAIAGEGLFDFLQLHGDETPGYCRMLSNHVRLIKAFRISDSLPANLDDYIPYCDMFLFDTAGMNYGGNGRRFDHELLSGYNHGKSFLLSGGISLSDAANLEKFCYSDMAGFDLNSKFEIKPGIKDVNSLRIFIDKVRRNNDVC